VISGMRDIPVHSGTAKIAQRVEQQFTFQRR